MSESQMNPLGNLYDSFIKILDNITIKYSSKAAKYETMETRQRADEYLDAMMKKDTFFTYVDYTEKDYNSVGITDKEIIKIALEGDTSVIPVRYHEQLLNIRRTRAIETFEEKNDYYRELIGYPSINDKKVFYLPKELADRYGIDNSIPIHYIRDYYNKQKMGTGDYLISVIEGTGYLDALYNSYPEKGYINRIGSNRIDLYRARSAKNFQILQLHNGKIKNTVYEQFIFLYDQCREYFVKTIYMTDFRSLVEYYDNFIAMCIFVMTTEQMIMRQIPLGVRREFFDIYAVKALYEAYDIPNNLYIDEEIQKTIVQNLNLLIQDKSDNRVIYNLANLLGFKDIKVYKYYLSKEQKYDIYGAPIIKSKKRFNNDTGDYEIVPDVNAMYDIYFQKEELKNDDFVKTFNDVSMRVDYDYIVPEDPFWWEDENLYKQVWESEYNFVESKYLGLSISYSMTEMLFDNIMLLKILINKSKEINDIMVTLPKMTNSVPIPIFDIVVLLVCLTAAKHNLYGEIITIPTQVIDVLDYIQNIEKTDMLVDTFSFDFEYFSPDSEDGYKHISEMKKILGEHEYEEFMKYISILRLDNYKTPEEKIVALNQMYSNIKNLYRLLSFEMTKTEDRKTYQSLKTMYDAVFYSREVRDIFTVVGEKTGFKRTAWDYFEFLHYHNPKLYNAIFTVKPEEQYKKYIESHPDKKMTFDEYIEKVEYGEIKLDYSELILDDTGDVKVKDEKIYTYVVHIISRLEVIIKDIDYMYLMGDTTTSLQDLFIKLVKFFKSYTVDLISTEQVLICDMKSENLMRLFDEIYYMEKTIQKPDKFNFSHGDMIHSIVSLIPEEDRINIHDKFAVSTLLTIDEDYQNTTNSIRLKDDIPVVNSNSEENEKFDLYDSIHDMSSNDILKDTQGIKMRDGIVKSWFE